MSTDSEPLGEFDLVRTLFAPLAGEGAFSLEDDAATLVPTPGHDLVLTKDALVEGVHFFPDDPPESIAAKLLRVNLSDLAAKGAKPRGFLLALARGPRQSSAWLARFAACLGQNARAFALPLLGGDTVKADQAMFSLTALGEVPSGRMVHRQGGAPGDALYVSGTIGDAALGLALRLAPGSVWGGALSEADRAHLLDRYLHPQPRMALAPVLLAHASAAMDISDGLVGDGEKLASRLGRTVHAAKVPLSPAARAAMALHPPLLETALTGGDDYEILMAVPQENTSAFEADALRAGCPVVRIGQLDAPGAPHRWLDATGEPLSFVRKSYAHF
ncbi:MAG: thiamine-phosphate kinase [Proteobacteria bacterium]|nr:thiamine-phosphate kinase [Pseudomonadota bacterium]